jgi:CRP-like cAMP-binding protein
MQARPSSNLRVIALFEELNDSELARIAESCSTRTYEKHAQILGDQDSTSDVFFILGGTVRASSISPKGREVIYSELKTGDIFGEFSAIDGRPRSSACSALTDCVVARMPSKAFFELLRGNGIVATKLIELMVAKMRSMSERVCCAWPSPANARARPSSSSPRRHTTTSPPTSARIAKP